jgi:hypothetical protein
MVAAVQMDSDSGNPKRRLRATLGGLDSDMTADPSIEQIDRWWRAGD